MNRENKRKQFEKGYYKNHPCQESFTCKVCGRLVTPEGAGSSHRNHCPYCLSSLHVDIEPGDRASDCGGVMEPVAVWVRKKRRVGYHPPVPPVRGALLQPGGRGRQPGEADEHRHEAPGQSTLPLGIPPGDGGAHGPVRNGSGGKGASQCIAVSSSGVSRCAPIKSSLPASFGKAGGKV